MKELAEDEVEARNVEEEEGERKEGQITRQTFLRRLQLTRGRRSGRTNERRGCEFR